MTRVEVDKIFDRDWHTSAQSDAAPPTAPHAIQSRHEELDLTLQRQGRYPTMPVGRGSLSSSTIRPTRSFKLADASFFGKLATKLDDYDDLPTLAEQQDEQEEVVVTGDSLLDLPEGLWPGRALAELAEETRSSLLSRKPDKTAGASSSRVTFDHSTFTAERCEDISDSHEEIEEETRARAAPPSSRPAARGSMMTHPPSRAIAVAGRGRGANPAGHTFGSLPRASPSGTMAHHAPRALPVPAAATALQRPKSARARLGGAAEAARADDKRSGEPKQPSSARAGEAPAEAREAEFGAAARGGALAWRPSSADTRPRVASRPQTRQQQLREAKADAAADAAAKKGAPFAFVVVCCGEEFEGYCCKRHHPSDDVICCAVHAPPTWRRSSSITPRGRSGISTSNSTGMSECRPCAVPKTSEKPSGGRGPGLAPARATKGNQAPRWRG